MATISTSGIAALQVIKSEHILRIINALNGVIPNDIVIGGSLTNGNSIINYGKYSHGEGINTSTYGSGSHAEGYYTTATAQWSHAEGDHTNTLASGSHAEGTYAIAGGMYSHAEGANTQAWGDASHTEGTETYTSSPSSHAEGYGTVVGYRTSLIDAYTDGSGNVTLPGNLTPYFIANEEIIILADDYVYIDRQNLSDLVYNAGPNTTTFNTDNYANSYVGFFISTTYTGAPNSHAEGYGTVVQTSNSHAEGELTLSSGGASHAEGSSTISSGYSSHAEGIQTLASGYYSHAEGNGTTAQGGYSHAEGYLTTAIGAYSHAEGFETVTSGSGQHVQGRYNLSSSADYAFIIGNGTTNSSRSNLIFASGSEVQITGSLKVTGSAIIKDILTLVPRTTTPGTPVEGMIIASGSVGSSVLYYYNGTTWNALF
jgi:hypothetical protein